MMPLHDQNRVSLFAMLLSMQHYEMYFVIHAEIQDKRVWQ